MNWISVEDRLPEFEENVLAYGEEIDNVPLVAQLLAIDKRGYYWLEYSDGSNTRKITHWMPLPNKPTLSTGNKK